MTAGSVDLNATLPNGGTAAAAEAESEVPAADGESQLQPAAVPAARHHRLDDNELSGFGRLAVAASFWRSIWATGNGCQLWQ